MNMLSRDLRKKGGRKPRAGGGFALLEVLVALLLFSFGILGLLGLQARAVSSESDAQDRNRAALIADRCASQMQLQASSLTMANGADAGSPRSQAGSPTSMRASLGNPLCAGVCM